MTSRHSWVLDPIDGTNNFALGIPQCAISLALLEDGEPVYGVVYDLGRRTLMHGGPGLGMHDGDRATAVPRRRQPGEPHRLPEPFREVARAPGRGGPGTLQVRCLGSATLHLAYVAAGILDGVVDYNVKIWDLAAAIPLCRAAGGEVRFLNGEQLPMRQFDLSMPGSLRRGLARDLRPAGGPD